MKTPPDVKPIEWKVEEYEVPQPDGDPADGRQPAGRIVHDERGTAIWKWRGDLATTGGGSGILKHLDPLDLKVEGQGGESGQSGKGRTGVFDGGGGYDPYNQGGQRSGAGKVRAGGRIKR